MEGLKIFKSLPLLNGLLENAQKSNLSFHTPGHKGRLPLLEGLGSQSIASIDLTELPGLDNLHQPQGIIAESQAKCAQWLGVKHSFFLVNGASVGIQAAILGCTGPNDLVMVPRNAHKSVTAALILSGATPVYYLPEIHPDFGIPLGQAPQAVLDKLLAHSAKLLLTLYPTYFGTTWDLKQVREQWDGLLLVDEAHGAHFPFSSGFPLSATKLGADIVVQSTHKTLAALTQVAMLHIGSDCPVSPEYFRQALDILHTTSPSYLLMASLESAFWDAAQKSSSHWDAPIETSLQLKNGLNAKGIRVLDQFDEGSYGIAGVDPSKILVHTRPGRTGEIVDSLKRRYGIQPELWDSENVLFLIGSGDTPQSVKRLEKALLEEFEAFDSSDTIFYPSLSLPKQVLTPREAYFKRKDLIPLTESVDRVCGETLSPYPPGIPAIVPGEIISKEMIEYITWSRKMGITWQGAGDSDLAKILVINENS